MNNMYALTTGIAIASLAIAIAADVVRIKLAQTRRSRSFEWSIVAGLPLGFEGSD